MRSLALRVLGVVGTALALAACSRSSDAPACDHAGCTPESSRTWAFQTSIEDELDLLVVVGDAQAGTAAAPIFAQVLASLPRGLPSTHAAFVPAWLAAGDCGSPPPARGAACGLGAPGGYLTTLGCGAQPNFAGALPDVFACLADPGAAAACGPPQPLEAMKRALSGTDGFLRPQAHLHVVIIAGGDDASAPDGAPVPIPVADYVTFLKGLKADPSEISVSVIGPLAACATGATPEQAVPRLVQLVDAFGSAGLYDPACGGHFAEALQQVAETIAVDVEPACLTAVRDVDPNAGGLQPDCVVEDWTAEVDGSEREALLRSCDLSARPCWRLDRGSPTSGCGDGGWIFTVDRGPGWCPQASTRTQITCLACADPADPACAPPP